MSYTPLLRRIREDKTNYRRRKPILISKNYFAAIRVSNQNIQIQVVKPTIKGDAVLIYAHSRELIKKGWKGSRKSLPACYLTGLLAGTKAILKNINECILYTGKRHYSPKIAASVKGLLDAGITIPIEEETIPKEENLNGKHIADYAKDLKEKDYELYNARFSGLIKEGFIPENYVENVERTKSEILGKSVGKVEDNKGMETQEKEGKSAQRPKRNIRDKGSKDKVSKKDEKGKKI